MLSPIARLLWFTLVLIRSNILILITRAIILGPLYRFVVATPIPGTSLHPFNQLRNPIINTILPAIYSAPGNKDRCWYSHEKITDILILAGLTYLILVIELPTLLQHSSYHEWAYENFWKWDESNNGSGEYFKTLLLFWALADLAAVYVRSGGCLILL